jgi:dihydroxyacid dehydratase/phosphogluconate dehydratase
MKRRGESSSPQARRSQRAIFILRLSGGTDRRKQTLKHQGPAREFDSEEEATKAIMAGRIRKGEVGD